MRRVAFVTSDKVPDLAVDDRSTAKILTARDVTVDAVRWQAGHIDWASFDALVIRSTWDYHLHPDRYTAWLQAREAEGANLWNPAKAVLANVHKAYLAAFDARGLGVVPTVHLEAGSDRTLDDVLRELACDEAVVKPAVSANAMGTWRTSRPYAAADRARFAEQSRSEDLLVQPFLPEIAADGEWSLMFFRGEFSHAVRKRPASGEFRVQEDYGGDAESIDPPAAIVEQAHAVLEAVDSNLLYARVDGIRRDGRFLLMELEINEPTLFLSSSAGAPARFADAILGVMHA